LLQPRALGPRQLEGPMSNIAVDDDIKHEQSHSHEEKMRAHTTRRGNAILMLGQLC